MRSDRVLDLAQAAPQGAHQVGWIGEGDVGLAAAPEQGPDPFDWIELRRVGREVVGGDPVLSLDELVQAAVAVDVEVVPHQDDRFAELLVGDDEQVTVVGLGEVAAPTGLVVRVDDRPVDQAGALASPVAGQGAMEMRRWERHHRGLAAARPSAGGRRHHREAGLVFEDEVASSAAVVLPRTGQVSFTRPATAASSGSTARRAGTW